MSGSVQRLASASPRLTSEAINLNTEKSKFKLSGFQVTCLVGAVILGTVALVSAVALAAIFVPPVAAAIPAIALGGCTLLLALQVTFGTAAVLSGLGAIVLLARGSHKGSESKEEDLGAKDSLNTEGSSVTNSASSSTSSVLSAKSATSLTSSTSSIQSVLNDSEVPIDDALNQSNSSLKSATSLTSSTSSIQSVVNDSGVMPEIALNQSNSSLKSATSPQSVPFKDQPASPVILPTTEKVLVQGIVSRYPTNSEPNTKPEDSDSEGFMAKTFNFLFSGAEENLAEGSESNLRDGLFEA